MDFGAFYHKIDVIYEDVIQLSLYRPPSIYGFLKQVDVNKTNDDATLLKLNISGLVSTWVRGDQRRTILNYRIEGK